MTKSSKLIATLGVVAGLGVAALPLGSVFASESVSGDVDLYVEVLPAIAMTISGNNDDNDHAGSGNGAVDVFAPAGAASSDIDGHTTPASATTVASSSWMSILPNATGTMTSTVTVYTNNASGYALAVKDADSTTALTRDNTDGKGAASIPASATTTAGTAGWSIAGGSLAASAITAADQTVKTTSAKTSGGDATTITYTVATDEDQATGIYSDTITYTATTN